MAEIDQDKIRDRAYALWEQDGSPADKDGEYWYRAERELAEEAGLDTSEQAADVKKPRSPAGFPSH